MECDRANNPKGILMDTKSPVSRLLAEGDIPVPYEANELIPESRKGVPPRKKLNF